MQLWLNSQSNASGFSSEIFQASFVDTHHWLPKCESPAFIDLALHWD